MDAEKLFIAMGYKLLPNQTLVLDGPICPDQVTNVSRDALTAFVECQIMKQVNTELATMGLATGWLDIFNFRECHIGDSSQSIKGLSQIIQSHHSHMMRKGKLDSNQSSTSFLSCASSILIYLSFLRLILDPYALPTRPLPPPASSSHHHYQQPHQIPMCTSHCSIHPFHHNQAPPPPLPNSFYNQTAYPQVPPPCTVHMQNNFAQPNGYYPPQQNLPHSKSLDQYDGKMPPNGNTHHRLSLDHNYKINPHLSPSQIQAPFDGIDSIAFNHPFNQPNSRSPLPYNLSSNLGHQMPPEQQYYPPMDPARYTQYPPPRQVYPEFHNQPLPTPVLDYSSKLYEYSDSSSPAMPENELISFGTEPSSRMKPVEVKHLRSSLKKSTQSNSDSLDFEPDLHELRALKQQSNKSVTPSSTSSDKARDGIGNYQTWDYVYNNLEKETHSKNMAGNHDDKVAAELQLENLKITSNGHNPPKLHPKSNGVAHRMPETLARSSGIHSSSVQTKSRTKSMSTATEMSNHEHKRTSSVLETVSSRSNNNVQKHKPPVQPQIVVPLGQWSCRFCTFLNPDEKRICEMCSKSKDFFNDADKSPATTTCV